MVASDGQTVRVPPFSGVNGIVFVNVHSVALPAFGDGAKPVLTLCTTGEGVAGKGGGIPRCPVSQTVVVVVDGVEAVVVPVTISTGPIPPQNKPRSVTIERAQPPHAT